MGRLLDRLLPRYCFGCERLLVGEPAPIGLCAACFGRLRRSPQPACCGCGRGLERPPSLPDYRCGACRASPPAWDRLFTVWRYERPIDRVFQALKYRRLDYLGDALGRAALPWLPVELELADRIVPVPLAVSKRLRRGFNQAELLARPIGRALGVPTVRALRRRAGATQSLLSRSDRMRNLEGAFRPGRPLARGSTVLLVDDVITTGATLAAAACALEGAGAARVWALALARTPRPTERVEDLHPAS